MEIRRIVVAITGASGAAIGVRILERLRDLDVESHLVISPWGRRTIQHEVDCAVPEVEAYAHAVYKPTDLSACIASGSFLTSGMVVAPCSMRTLAAIAIGLGGDLITRAADITLKERRRLVLVPRESPLSEIHLENMLKLSRAGASIVNPVPAFYNRPTSIDQVVDQIAARALDQLGLHVSDTPRWSGFET
ncbi:MAG: UbiX family flavin prenyltransferase [Pseudonocardiaceae bacterium]|nr:UbiX family flavin prenyltransferase [Pseudonocardiaceae bacterium]